MMRTSTIYRTAWETQPVGWLVKVGLEKSSEVD